MTSDMIQTWSFKYGKLVVGTERIPTMEVFLQLSKARLFNDNKIESEILEYCCNNKNIEEHKIVSMGRKVRNYDQQRYQDKVTEFITQWFAGLLVDQVNGQRFRSHLCYIAGNASMCYFNSHGIWGSNPSFVLDHVRDYSGKITEHRNCIGRTLYYFATAVQKKSAGLMNIIDLQSTNTQQVIRREENEKRLDEAIVKAEKIKNDLEKSKAELAKTEETIKALTGTHHSIPITIARCIDTSLYDPPEYSFY